MPDPKFNTSIQATLSVQDDTTGNNIVTKLFTFIQDMVSFALQGRVYLQASGVFGGNSFVFPGFGSGPLATQPIKLIYIKNVSGIVGSTVTVTLTGASGTPPTFFLDNEEFILLNNITGVTINQITGFILTPPLALLGIGQVFAMEYFVAA